MGSTIGWFQQLYNAVLANWNQLGSGLSPAALAFVAICAMLGVLVLGVLICRSLPSKAPPVFEGVPLVGGIIKFLKARLANGLHPLCPMAPRALVAWALVTCKAA